MRLGTMRLAWVALAMALGTAGSAAPDGASIMRKAVDAMSKAKTYQANWRMVISMGNMGNLTMNMDMKTTSDGKARITTEPAGQGTGMMAAGGAMASSLAVSDGKTLYMYMKAMNSYMKMPVSKDRNPAFTGQLGALNQKGTTFKLIGTEFVRGRKCWVVSVNQKMPPNVPPGSKATVHAYVDQQTGRLRQMKSKMTMPGMGPGPNAGAGTPKGQAKPAPMVMTTTMVLISEKINAPIPASTFKFTPPKGAREMQPGMMGGPGLPSGGPMGGPSRRR